MYISCTRVNKVLLSTMWNIESGIFIYLSCYLAVIKLDTIFLRTSLSTLKLFSSAKPVIWQQLSCNSSNLIYLVRGKNCHLQYVGSTTTEFKVRFRNHKSSMKTKTNTCEVAIHFNRTPLMLSDFTFQCIDQIQTSKSENIENLLITKEA